MDPQPPRKPTDPQKEPSVRPKIRIVSTDPQQTPQDGSSSSRSGPIVPRTQATGLSRQMADLSLEHRNRARRESRLSEDFRPDTPIVREYRSERTGDPNWNRMRFDIPADIEDFPSEMTAHIVTQRSKSRIKDMKKWEDDKSLRQHQVLGREGFKLTPQGRYLKATEQHDDRRRLMPAQGARDDSEDWRVHRTSDDMQSGAQPESMWRKFLTGSKPVGRMGWGQASKPLTPSQSQQLESFRGTIGGNLSSKEQDFMKRLIQLLDEDRDLFKTYVDYRRETDPRSSQNIPLQAYGRMTPRPTVYDIGDMDKRRVAQIRGNLDTERGVGEREERLERGHQRRKSWAKLDSYHMPKDLRPIPAIEEQSESSSSEDEG